MPNPHSNGFKTAFVLGQHNTGLTAGTNQRLTGNQQSVVHRCRLNAHLRKHTRFQITIGIVKMHSYLSGASRGVKARVDIVDLALPLTPR